MIYFAYFQTDHTMLVGPGANAFAKEMGINQTPTEDLITDTARKELEEFKKFRNAVNVEFRQR